MKLPIIRFAGLLVVFSSMNAHSAFSQAAEKSALSIGLSYFSIDDKVPYVVVKTKAKIEGRFRPVGGEALKIYLGSESAGSLIKEVMTDDKGEAFAYIPPALHQEWGQNPKKTFLATFAGDKKYDSASADLTVSRAKMVIDTSGDRKIVATLLEWKDSGWVPVKGVDVAIAIKRLDAYLNVNQTPTYSTDSTGRVTAEFKRDSLAGDVNGNIVIVAKVDDNDSYGNLLQEMTVPWGKKFATEDTFGKRTLYATGNRAPVWLLLMSGSIILCVWSILIYLVVNLVRIKRLGKMG
ncbi:MAG TPA: hypothetical protein VHE34_00030 [Puia sp.]|uniref:hypothetical protein n=1 Tax=Puia sp. TaxID=2045100 RepID=UPI002C4B295D|nr:hypothetical protein [Puia sp.]HVU93572.1 hypothetical protein [Puia sp.]